MVDHTLIDEAIALACDTTPGRPHVRPGTTLGDWQTFNPGSRPSQRRFRQQLLRFLIELPEDVTVADIRWALE